MNQIAVLTYLSKLSSIDPSPFFLISLVPYLLFLYWGQKSLKIPQIALLGFKLTLLFVAVTVALAIFAMTFYKSDLTSVDWLHGSAEAFLTVSDALIVIGFFGLLNEKEVNNS